MDDGSCTKCRERGAPPLQGSATEHKQIDFTGGYEANAECTWDIRCEDSEAVVFDFISLDTERNFDFVEVSDFDGDSSIIIERLHGDIPPEGVLAAASGQMSVLFTSDGSFEADGFSASYWCASPGELGCTAPDSVT